jgi:hypothetical protein
MRVMKVFWSAAVALSLWDLLVEPLFTETVMVTCSSAGSLDWPQPVPAAQAAGFLGDWLARLQPVLLALAGIAGAGIRPRLADLREAGLVVAAVILAVFLLTALIGL